MEGQSCCFTGHRDLTAEQLDAVRARLMPELCAAIQNGYSHFLCRFAAGTDLLFAELVSALKSRFPLTLEAVLPYPQRRNTPDDAFQRLIAACDGVTVCSERYYKGCFQRRNQYMVDTAQTVIAVWDGRKTGGTASTLRYAKSKGKTICILRPPDRRATAEQALRSRVPKNLQKPQIPACPSASPMIE